MVDIGAKHARPRGSPRHDRAQDRPVAKHTEAAGPHAPFRPSRVGRVWRGFPAAPMGAGDTARAGTCYDWKVVVIGRAVVIGSA